MKEIEVIILDKVYKIKRTKLGLSLGTIFLYKQYTGKDISLIEDIKDLVYLLFSALQSCNKDFSLTFEELCDVIDENPDILGIFHKLNDTNIESNLDEKKN
jgi:hypothetical protein